MADKTATCPKCSAKIQYKADAMAVTCPQCGMNLVRQPKESAESTSSSAGLLVVVAIIGGVVGFLLLSQVTTGVGVVGLACLAGILARIAQARAQHAELRDLLGKPKPE